MTISAPGEAFEDLVRAFGSCHLRGTGIISLAAGGGLDRNLGTSVAAPHLAGVLALIQDQAFRQGLNLLDLEEVRGRIRAGADRIGEAPLDSLSANYTFDGEREGILWAPGALAQP